MAVRGAGNNWIIAWIVTGKDEGLSFLTTTNPPHEPLRPSGLGLRLYIPQYSPHSTTVLFGECLPLYCLLRGVGLLISGLHKPITLNPVKTPNRKSWGSLSPEP